MTRMNERRSWRFPAHVVLLTCSLPVAVAGACGGSAAGTGSGGSAGIGSGGSGNSSGSLGTCDQEYCSGGILSLGTCGPGPFPVITYCDFATYGVECVTSGPCHANVGGSTGIGQRRYRRL